MPADEMPVRCPVIQHPDRALADPAEFDPLLRRLADPAPVAGAEEFARGTLQPDGRLDLCKQGLGPVTVRAVLSAAVASRHPRHLLLGTNALGAAGVAAVAETLAGDHRIETVYLGCNHITDVDPLADRLAGDATVTGLWLKRNPIGDAGAAAIARALRTNTSVRTLDLFNTGVTEAGLAQLAEALAARTRPIERLYLGGNGLGPSAAPVLAELVRCGVTELFLSVNHLGDRGLTDLVSAIETPIGLGAGGNGLTPVGVEALAARLDLFHRLDLARPPSERVLGGSSNVVGDRGAAALAAALPDTRLRWLDLRHTGITGRGAKALLAALESATALEYLGLGFGIPRRIKRAASTHLRPATPVHPDIGAIVSVYR
jgi:hypothetical protein